MRQAEKSVILLLYGCWGYPLLEILFRGWSHWSMALAGGICFSLIGLISDSLRGCPLPVRCAACALAVTLVEFSFGCVCNLGLHLAIWDYSAEPGNLAGQICPRFSLVWMALSAPLILLADRLSLRPRKNNSCGKRKISI